jgi:hypothetical protein
MAMTSFRRQRSALIVLRRLAGGAGFTGRYGRVGQCVTRDAVRRLRQAR